MGVITGSLLSNYRDVNFFRKEEEKERRKKGIHLIS